ncbi:protein RALF-like 19 [Tripterygium wilfordii]|uniref:protein RALF-like 19 n=1 Tax=Tripterygium wilfordii TaxID=458696 RepID=UPI0018F818BB|nr:protein RALF-like 19 [Tripterygium wilfordii]
MGCNKFWPVFLPLALAAMANLSLRNAATSSNADLLTPSHVGTGRLIEDDTEMLMDSEINRRALGERRGRYISYGAMRANNVIYSYVTTPDIPITTNATGGRGLTLTAVVAVPSPVARGTLVNEKKKISS